MKKITLPIIALALMCGQARARDYIALPSSDVDAKCAAWTSDHAGQATCVEREQHSYDYLRVVWDQLSEPRKQLCVNIGNKSRVNQIWFYTVLDQCVTGWLPIEEEERKRSDPVPTFDSGSRR